MHLQHPILATIEPDALARVVSRREALRAGASTSTAVVAGLAMASVPVALAALARDVYAQAAVPTIVEVLNFALTLEYLEDEFYRTGLAGTVAASLLPPELNAIQQVSKHETAHVNFLLAVIPSLGGAPVALPTFDFTAGGAFPGLASGGGLEIRLLSHWKIPVMSNHASIVILSEAKEPKRRSASFAPLRMTPFNQSNSELTDWSLWV